MRVRQILVMLWIAAVLMVLSGWLGGLLALVTVSEHRYCGPSDSASLLVPSDLGLPPRSGPE
jgi:hypothetical protein